MESRRKRLTLVAAILGSSVVFLDSTVVNVALPALRRDFAATLAEQQWVVEGYLLALASLLLIGGSLGDLLGRRRVFSLGLITFGATSLLCAVAPSAGMLVAARIVQGVAGALLVPSSLALITAAFPVDERGGAVGSWTAWTGVTIVAGPPIGGVLVDAVSWRLIFALNVPLVLATLVLTHAGVEESRDTAGERGIDLGGALLCAAGLSGLVFAFTEEPARGFGDPVIVATLVGGVVAAVAFVLHEARTERPMLPLSLFRDRNFAVANLTTLVVYAGLIGALFFVSIFLQQVARYSALEAGLATAPVSMIMFLLARRFGALSDQVGPRLFMSLGPIVAGAGLLLLVRIDSDGDYLGVVLPALLLFGLGLSLTVAPLTATVLEAVDDRYAGVASGVNNAISRIAGLLAIAAFGAAVSAQFGSSLDERLRDASLSARGRAAVASAKERALAARPPELPAAERARLEPALDHASVAGFRLGIGLGGALMICGGLIAAVGIRNPRRPVVPRLEAIAPPAPACTRPRRVVGEGVVATRAAAGGSA
jgi:EmrB/QacA subfamily drug resistance transporter